MGIIPLYIGWRADGGIMFSSELKALKTIAFGSKASAWQRLPVGTSTFTQWYKPSWQTRSSWPLSYKEQLTNPDYSELRTAFEKAVAKRLMSDVSLITNACTIFATNILKLFYRFLGVSYYQAALILLCRICGCPPFYKQQQEGKVAKWGSQIHSFIGLKGSPDLKAAKEVADFWGQFTTVYIYNPRRFGCNIRCNIPFGNIRHNYNSCSNANVLNGSKIKALGLKWCRVVKVLMK